MSEKVVLPNFDLPRDSTRIAMRALWAMGGVVVVATLGLGLAMWHHQSVELATAQAATAKAEAARRAAMAPPPAPKPVETSVEKAAPVGGGSTTTLANVAAGSATPVAAETNARPAMSARRHGSKAGHSHARGSAAAVLERIDGKGAKVNKPAAKSEGHRPKNDDDFLDSLLKK